MEAAAATRGVRRACAHCGLPVATTKVSDQEALYCCHACRLVSLIIGKQQSEQDWNLLRLGFGTLLAMNIMMISLLFYTGSIEPATGPVFRLVLLGLATPALAILLPPFLAGALRAGGAKQNSLDALIACGSLAAFSVSAVSVLRGSGEVLFDTATMLPVLVTFGKMIEVGAKTRAADLLHSLDALLPATALRLSPEGACEVASETLRVGDLIRVRPGERFAVDGLLLEGTSSIEEAAFTGEFLPRHCRPGDQVIAGTINGSGSLVVQAQRTGRDLLLHDIVSMIDAAWLKPSHAERIAERAAALFIPLLLLIAAGSVIGWTLLGNPSQGLMSALSVLVVACPCTMGIATPLATSLAIARAARAGIIVRGGSVMEQIAGTDLIFFDKTGTVTQGRPALREIQLVDQNLGEDELLGRLAALESADGHPLGRSVVAEALRRGCEVGKVAQVRVEPGGLTGAVTWRGTTTHLVAGSSAFLGMDATTAPEAAEPISGSLAGHGSPHGSEAGFLDTHREEEPSGDCHTVIEVAWDGKLRGRLLFNDALRGDALDCIRTLDERGISCVLLSGDRYPAAAWVANRAGIARVEAPRSPAQKLQAIADSSAAGRTVAMVGDGINDAPALAAAHIGIAFCAGMELARQAGNVVIISGRLMQVPWLVGLSRQTERIIRGNFAWSFGYNAVALGAAAAGLLHPLLAALAMVLSSVTVLCNSLRITRFPGEAGQE
jgi:P-type Cu2+ transporter